MKFISKKKGMLEFLLILVTGKKMEEKKETKTHHLELNDLNFPQTSVHLFFGRMYRGIFKGFLLALRIGLLLAKAMDHPNSQQLWTWHMCQPNRTMPSAPVSLNHESCYAFSHNHGSGKWPLWRLKSSAREPFDTSMIVGGKVMKKCATSSVEVLWWPRRVIKAPLGPVSGMKKNSYRQW